MKEVIIYFIYFVSTFELPELQGLKLISSFN